MLFLILCLLAACASSSPLGKVRVCGRWFCDPSGRVRIFHGFNDIQEAKDTGIFDGSNFLPHLLLDGGVQDALASWGFNVARVPMMWSVCLCVCVCVTAVWVAKKKDSCHVYSPVFKLK